MDRIQNQESARKAFSRDAGTYDAYGHVQRHVAGEVMAMIPGSAGGKRILEIGCGTGMLTEQLAQQFPGRSIDALDISADMVLCAQEKLALRDNVVFHHTSVRDYTADECYGLIVSSSAIHWMFPFEELFGYLRSLLTPRGCLVFSLMLNGTLGELHELRSRLFPELKPARTLPDEDDIQSALKRAGLVTDFFEVREPVTHYQCAREFLKCIRYLGVTGGDYSKGSRNLNRAELRELVKCYDEQYGEDLGVRVTYRTGYVVAWQ